MVFIQGVVDGDIGIMNVDVQSVVNKLQELELPSMNDDSGDDGGYGYLLRMPVSTLTMERKEKLEAQHRQMQNDIETLEAQTPVDIWLKELEEFEGVYDKHFS